MPCYAYDTDTMPTWAICILCPCDAFAVTAVTAVPLLCLLRPYYAFLVGYRRKKGQIRLYRLAPLSILQSGSLALI